MEDLKHLGQPFVPLVCRHLKEKYVIAINSIYIERDGEIILLILLITMDSINRKANKNSLEQVS